jgi:hypothetical protein
LVDAITEATREFIRREDFRRGLHAVAGVLKCRPVLTGAEVESIVEEALR